MGEMFPSFQSPGILLNCHDFSDIMESDNGWWALSKPREHSLSEDKSDGSFFLLSEKNFAFLSLGGFCVKIFIKELHKLHLLLLSHVHYICGVEAQLFIHFWKNIIFSAVFFFTFGHFNGFNAIVTELVFNIQKLESSLVHQKQIYNFHLKLTNNFWNDFCFLTPPRLHLLE